MFSSISSSQTIDPRYLEFSASADHYATTASNLPVVEGYKMAWYRVGAASPDRIFELGKPTPDSSGTIFLDIYNYLPTRPVSGISYTARIVALGPTGSSASADSNPFIFSGPCAYQVSTTTASAPAIAITAQITVTAGDACGWSATSHASWMTLSSPGGTGAGTVTVSIAANSFAARTGTVTVAGQTITVNQAGATADVLVADTFTGTNGTLLPAHSPDLNVPGTPWAITGGPPTPTLINSLLAITAGTGHLQATLDAAVADARVGVDVKVGSGNFLAGVAFRLTNANNHFVLVAYADSLQVYRKQGGGPYIPLGVAAAVAPIVPGSTHRLEVRATGSTIEGWWDNVFRLSVTDTFQQTATRHGLDWNSAYDASTTYDNFEIRSTGALPAPPGTPNNPSPADGATTVANTTLTWTSSGATSYNLAFGTTNPPPSAATGLTSASYTPPPTANNTTYYWKVTASNAGGNTAGPVWSFTTGADLLVADTLTGSNGTLLPAHAPDLNVPGATWTITGALPVPTLNSNVVAITAGTGHLQATLDATVADVRVGADVKVSSGNFLAGVAFRLTDANNHFVLVAYADSLQIYRKQSGGPYIPLGAAAAVAPIVPGSTHRLEVRATGSTIEGWWDNIFRLSITDTFQQTATRHGLDWNSAYDPNTTYDNFEIRSTGAVPAPPGTPDNPSPAIGATDILTKPTLTWSAAGATSYDLAFGTVNPPPSAAAGLVGASYAPPTSPNTTYYWKVTALNAGGNTAGPVWSFTTAAPPADLLVTDTFAGTNGTLLPAHAPDLNVPGATWTITGAPPKPTLTNNRVGITAGTGHLQATLDAAVADVRVGVDVKVPSGYFLAGVAFRLTDANNHFVLVAYADSLQVYRKQGGGPYIPLGAAAAVGPIVPGSTHRLEVRATGSTIEGWWDDVFRLSITDTFQQTATRHGLDWNSAYDPNTIYDNFEIRLPIRGYVP